MTNGFGIVDGPLDPARRVVEPSGEIDLATAPQLEACLDALFDSGTRQIIIDLGDVTFIDSTGLRALLKARKRLDRAGGILVVVCHDASIRRVFDVSGMVDLLHVVESRRDASALTGDFAPASTT